MRYIKRGRPFADLPRPSDFVPEATDPPTVLSVVVVAVYIGVVVVQVSVPSVVRIVLSTTPPNAVVAHVVVISIVVAVTARENDEAMAVLHCPQSEGNTFFDNKAEPFVATGKVITRSVHGRMK